MIGLCVVGQNRLAEAIGAWRRRQRITKADLVKNGGISANTLWLIEQGTTKTPEMETLRKIAHGLATDPYTHEVDAVVYKAAWAELASVAGLPEPVTEAPQVTLDDVLSGSFKLPGTAAALAEWIRTHPDATEDQVRMAFAFVDAMEKGRRN